MSRIKLCLLTTCWCVLDLVLQREMSLTGNIPGIVQIHWDEFLENWLTHVQVYMWCLSTVQAALAFNPLTQIPAHVVVLKLSPLLSQLQRCYSQKELLWYLFLIYRQNNWRCKHQEIMLEAFWVPDYIFLLSFIFCPFSFLHIM